jgi:hypothetical protein
LNCVDILFRTKLKLALENALISCHFEVDIVSGIKSHVKLSDVALDIFGLVSQVLTMLII